LRHKTLTQSINHECVWSLGPVQASSLVFWIHTWSSSNVRSSRCSTLQHILPSSSSQLIGWGRQSCSGNGGHAEDWRYYMSAVQQTPPAVQNTIISVCLSGIFA